MQPIGTTVSVQGTIFEAGAGTVGARPRTGSPAPIVQTEAGDSAALSAEARARARAGAWATALDSLQSLLGKFKAAESSAPATRQEIKGILSSVRGVTSGGPISNVPPPFTVSDIADGVERFRVVGANLKPGESADVEVTVTQSAQTGALLLSFGGYALNLGGLGGPGSPNERFVIEVGGASGARELSFASGTTLLQVVNTINTFAEVTGVSATLSGTDAVRLSSTRFSDYDFVSVKIVDSGGAVGNGIYRYDADNNFNAHVGSVVAFAAASAGVTDAGQSLLATINGNDYTGDGFRLRSVGANVDAIILLEQWRAQTLGTFTAATVSAPPPVGPSGGVAPVAGLDLEG